MERRNRNILVLLIALVIVAAAFSSFGMEYFAGNTPEITLPEITHPAGPEGEEPGRTDGVIRVEVTPDTVQGVVETLERPASYYQEITVTYGAAGGSLTAKQWVDGGWSRTEAALPGGMIRHTIVGEGMVHYWYGNSRTWASAPGDQRSHDLEGPHIPTYEDILDVEKDHITRAGYEEKDDMACVFAEIIDSELGSVSRYWVSVDNGLLVAAERARGEELLLTMSAAGIERPVAAGTVFALPDGTQLHAVSVQPQQ